MFNSALSLDRHRVGWWCFFVALLAAVAWTAFQFLGALSLGVFGYYAMRPVRDRIGRHVASDRLTATLTASAILLPVILLVAYLLFRVSQRLRGGAAPFALDALPAEQREQARALLRDPLSALGGQEALGANADLLASVASTAFGALLTVGIALTLAAVLLVRDDTLAAAGVELTGGRDTAVYAYAAAVDEDLESVFFGNLLFAATMAVVATAAYWVTNLLAPSGLAVPMVPVLGALTGAASLIPIVVGKVVYVPVVAYLALQALSAGGAALGFVVVALVAYVFVLDLIPQAVVQPYVSGRRFDTVLLLFAYVLGPVALGWAGFFLFPILFILVFEAVDLLAVDLARGRSPDPTTSLDATATGTDPTSEREDVPGEGEADEADEEDATDGA